VALLTSRVLFYLPVAVVALCAKVAQLGFVQEVACADWAIVDWLNLLAFANNAAGIVDLRKLEQHGVFQQLQRVEQLSEASTEELQQAWMKSFGHALQELHGPALAIFFVATAQAADLSSLLNPVEEI